MKHLGTKTIETRRLVLRKFTLSDAEPMYRNWASDPEVTRYLLWPAHESEEETKGILKGWIAAYEKPEKYEWCIELKEIGEAIGSIVVLKIGILKTLFIGALLSAGTNLLFSALAGIGHSLPFLVFTVSADNLSGGLASAAFIAYLSGLTNVQYSATQYAVFSSIMLILPKFLAGFSGVLVESLGYSNFFILTAALGVPVLVLIPIIGYLSRHRAPDKN